MLFEIARIILWPKDTTKTIRIVRFEPGRLNIISGVSRTGKSAIIPIIDYCLGADKCTIPTGVIRQKTAWFGVVVRTTEGEKLLARREPGALQATDDMYVVEAPEIVDLPRVISKNTARDLIKQRLDHLDFSVCARRDKRPDAGQAPSTATDAAGSTPQGAGIGQYRRRVGEVAGYRRSAAQRGQGPRTH